VTVLRRPSRVTTSLGGILDEADSHKVTKDKDYAQRATTRSTLVSSLGTTTVV
jgi:hypothetical protein